MRLDNLFSAEEKILERFTPEDNEIDKMLYVYRIHSCLFEGRFEAQSMEAGTVMRPEALREYDHEAGFSKL